MKRLIDELPMIVLALCGIFFISSIIVSFFGPDEYFELKTILKVGFLGLICAAEIIIEKLKEKGKR